MRLHASRRVVTAESGSCKYMVLRPRMSWTCPARRGCFYVCETGTLGVFSKGFPSPAGLWMWASTMLGHLCLLAPDSSSTGWWSLGKSQQLPLIACETSLGFFLTSQKAVTNLLSPPRRPGPARDMLGSEKCSVKNVRKSKWKKVMISYFSAMCMYNNEPWEWGRVSPNYSSLNIYIA